MTWQRASSTATTGCTISTDWLEEERVRQQRPPRATTTTTTTFFYVGAVVVVVVVGDADEAEKVSGE